MQVIPAIDLRGGKCVRLTQGRYDLEKTYSENPVEIAERFWAEGATSLHCVDLEGARQGRFQETKTIREILRAKPFALQIGGGIRTLQQAVELLSLGVTRIVVGTIAVRDPEQIGVWIHELGADFFCIGLDIKNGELATEGWTQTSQTKLESLVGHYRGLGVRRFLSTDISVDGTLMGPNLELYHNLVCRFPNLDWIASGGVSSLHDLKVLKGTGVSGVVVGKALYEGVFSVKEAREAAC